MSESKLSIRQRIVAVQRACGAVGKGRKAPAAAGGYAFSGIDDVIEHLRPHLIEHGVVIVPSVIDSTMDIREGRNGKLTTIERQTVEVSFQNADQPEDAFSVQVVGMGIGSGDKNPGIAYSYALKTALLAVFNLRGQPDAENGDGQLPSKNQPPHRQSNEPSPKRSPGPQTDEGVGKGDAVTDAQKTLLERFMNDERAQTIYDGVTIRSRISVLLKEGCSKRDASDMIGWVQDQFKKEAVA